LKIKEYNIVLGYISNIEILYVFITGKINKNKKKNDKLSHPLFIHFGSICNKNIIQLWRSNPNLEGVNISSTKFGQPINIFVSFSRYEQMRSYKEEK
jgi:hypothetical protein